MLCYKATSIHQQSKRKQLKRRINYVASCLPGVRRIADAGTERSGTEGERPSYLSADDPRRLRYAQPPRGALNPSGRARGGLRWRPQAAGAGPRRRGHGRRLPNGCSPPASSSGSTMERVSGFWSLVNIRATANSDDGEGISSGSPQLGRAGQVFLSNMQESYVSLYSLHSLLIAIF